MNWYVKISQSRQERSFDEIMKDIEKYGPKGTEYPGDIDAEIDKYKDKQKDLYDFRRRYKFVSDYSWAVPNREIIDYIKKFVGNDKAIEIGAGYGLWAKLLKDMGLNIVAIDPMIFPGDKEIYDIGNEDKKWTQVEKMDHYEALDNFPDANVLIFIWPSYDEGYAYEALELFDGNKIVYIGEGRGGCTADESFHNLLDNEWGLVNAECSSITDERQSYSVDQWPGLHDSAFFYIRK